MWYILLGYTSDLPHINAKVACLSATAFTQSKMLLALEGLSFVKELFGMVNNLLMLI